MIEVKIRIEEKAIKDLKENKIIALTENIFIAKKKPKESENDLLKDLLERIEADKKFNVINKSDNEAVKVINELLKQLTDSI